ncbi:MAG: glycine betaine ABC transporter substrate-binding protein [Eubacteriales bacterium]
MKRKIVLVFCFFLIFIVTQSTSSLMQNKAKERNKNRIRIGFQSYPSSIVETFLLKNILEEKGYKVSLKNVEKDDVFDALKENEIDVSLGSLLPDLDYTKTIKYEKHINNLAINYDSSSLNLYVPSYTHIATTEELNFYKNKFGKKIFVINNSHTLKEQLNNWIVENDFDFKIIECTANELDEMLNEGIINKDWIIFAGWEPHYLLGKYDLRALEGERFSNIYPQQKHTIVRSRFKNQKVIKILQDFFVEPWDMNELIYMFNQTEKEQYDRFIGDWINSDSSLKKRYYK